MVRNSIKAEYMDLHHLPQQTFYGDYSKSFVPMNNNSHMITKTKPKIRIIHIFAPEIINTDVKNFRALVQSLTGKPEIKPEINKTGSKKKITKPKVQTTPSLPQESVQEQVVKEEWGSSSNTNTYFNLDGLINLDEDDHIFSSQWFDLQQQ